jgi:integrase/recombinase XerD
VARGPTRPAPQGLEAREDDRLCEYVQDRLAGKIAKPNGGPMTRHNLGHLVAKYVEAAAATCPGLAAKNVTPHTLRHSTAMALLASGVDTSTIALWLGHEHVQSTQIYLHRDLTMKERALARTAPLTARPGRYRPPDGLLAFLDGL